MSQLVPKTKVVFRVAIALPIYQLFDYSAPDNLDLKKITPGIRLLVPFGNSKKVAYLLQIINSSDSDIAELKTVEAVLDNTSLLQQQDLRLLDWASKYYHYPIGEVINAAFPLLLRKGRVAELKQESRYQLTEKAHNSTPSDFTRAPKQLALLLHFKQFEEPLSNKQISAWEHNWRQPLKCLLNKKYLQIVTSNSIVKSTKIIKQAHLSANPEQQKAIDTINKNLNSFTVYLLEGVTGSGKTEVYMQTISRVLEQGKQVLVLLPEITLTPQLQQRFEDRFITPIAVFHSSLSASLRQNAWLNFQQGNVGIMLGTRSALFTPFHQPGLIILDEEHDSSFKQQERFRFSARHVAIVRARNLNIPIILGSATPSLESMRNVDRQRFQLLQLSQRAGNAQPPDLQLLDIRNKKMFEGLSQPLLKAIKKNLAEQQQVLLFLNRRGYAPTLICHACGWVARCPHCDANLVIHQRQHQLRCHHCSRIQPLLKQCPACSAAQLTALGLGTERVEKALQEQFPEEKIIRLDRDSTQRKGTLEKMLQTIQQGSSRIILGTQMLAKGHHFPNVTLVALLDVDSGLFSIDFHATEKLAQLIVQVAGRAGRAEKKGKVILQTRQPDHPLLRTMIYQDYRAFTKVALQERKQAQLPPFSYQALLRITATETETELAQTFLTNITLYLQQNYHGSTSILGPTPSPMARKAGNYHYQLLFQSNQRQELHILLDCLIPRINKLKKSAKVRWSLDVDPVDLY